jgi:predicted NBD/HSP70 family sugar kinase
MSHIIGIDLGGGVANAGDLLLGAARASLKQYAFKAVAARVKAAASEMGEDAPLLGAAGLARNRLIGSL